MIIYTGSVFISCMEMGGIAGSVAAGYSADKLVAMVNKQSMNEPSTMRYINKNYNT